MEDTATKVPTAALRAVAAGLGALARTATSYRTTLSSETEPEPGSQAALEQADQAELAARLPWGDEPVSSGYYLADRSLARAGEHLRAVETILLADRPFLFPMVTLGRSILEHAAQAWWLLDPSLEARSRLARIITLQLHDLHDEDRELERISNLLADQLQARERSEALQAVAREKGFRVLTPRRSAPAIEEEWPATIRLVGQLLEDPQGQLADELVPGDRSEYGRIIYSQWSAVAHGRVRSIVKEPDATELAMATAVIARGFSAAFERQLLAYGWDTQQWTDTRRATSEAVEWMLSLHDDGTWEQPAARSNARPLP